MDHLMYLDAWKKFWCDQIQQPFVISNLEGAYCENLHKSPNEYLLGCSKSNASCPITLAHNIRGKYWWECSVSTVILPISRYMLLPSDRCQQRGVCDKMASEAKVCV